MIVNVSSSKDFTRCNDNPKLFQHLLLMYTWLPPSSQHPFSSPSSTSFLLPCYLPLHSTIPHFLCHCYHSKSHLIPSSSSSYFVVSHKGLMVDMRKVAKIQQLLLPTLVTELQLFLGHVGFYHRYIRHNVDKVTPLTKLLHKAKKYEWTLKLSKHSKSSNRLSCKLLF